MTKKVSIIIPLYDLNDRFRKDFNRFLNLDYPDYEIIIVHDSKINFQHERAKTINTNKDRTSPAEKRDLAIKEAKGEICAFIDDDAYPDKNWIKNAIGYFDDEKVGAVGGPGLTPPEDTFMMKAGGLCYESILGSGPHQYRFVKGKNREVDDLTAYNLFIRKSVLENTGGYGSTFYGGEDTKLCIEITKLKKDILYRPDVEAYHHRRPLLIPHLLQVGNVGLHRGYFVKKYPQTSRRIVYFMPAIFTIVLFISFALSIISQKFAIIFGTFIASFLSLAFITCFIRSKRLLLSIFSAFGIFLMHISYGTNFLRGLTRKELKM